MHQSHLTDLGNGTTFHKKQIGKQLYACFNEIKMFLLLVFAVVNTACSAYRLSLKLQLPTALTYQ